MARFSFTGQGSEEYIVMLAVVMLVALAALAVVTGIYPGTIGISESESATYWASQSFPIRIMDAQFGNSLSCTGVSGNFTGYKLLLANADVSTITLRNVSIGGTQRVFCIAGGAEGGVDISPSKRRSINVLMGTNCTTGSAFEAAVSFTYDKPPFSGRLQTGDKRLVVRCSGVNLSSSAGEGGISAGYELSLLTGNPLAAGRVGDPYSATLTPLGGASPYAWGAAGLPAGLSMSNGVISGTPEPGSAGAHSITVSIADANGASASTVLTINIANAPPGPLFVTTTSLPVMVEGTYYDYGASAILFTSSGGVGTTRNWAVTGTLPSGIYTLGRAQLGLYGTPAAGSAGVYPLSLRVSDGTQTSPTVNLTLTVAPAGSLRITSSSLAKGVVSSSYSQPLGATGGVPPYSWSCFNLPLGLNCSSSGDISGIPSYGSEGNYTVGLFASDSASANANASLVLSVLPDGTTFPPISITTSWLSSAILGYQYTSYPPLSATGGRGGYSWNVTGLPSGLSANATGIISGIPANGTAGQVFPLAVTAYDGVSTGSRTLNLSVNYPELLINGPQSLPNGTVGTPYALYQFTATGGMGGPYYWYVSSGHSLPPGLSLSSSGILSGTPTTAGFYPFSVRANDSAKDTGLSVWLNVSAMSCPTNMSITTANLSAGVKDISYSSNLSATGGNGTYSWSASGLPSGLSISSSNGTIYGTPTASGVFPVIISATGSICGSTTKSFNLSIGLSGLYGNWLSLASSSDGSKLAAAIEEGYIYTSPDGGATWLQRSYGWRYVFSSSDGANLAAIATSGAIYTSADSGANWVLRDPTSHSWSGISMSSDGTSLAAAPLGSYIHTSTDGGATWTERTASGSRSWRAIAMSSDGTKIVAAVASGYIYTSTDGGATWTERTGAGSGSWRTVASSSDGTKIVAAQYEGYAYTSTDSGATWTARTGLGPKNWFQIVSSSDGTKLAGAVYADYIYTSADSGATWAERTNAGTRSWQTIASSSDGTRLISGDRGGYLYTSTDSGATWVQR